MLLPPEYKKYTGEAMAAISTQGILSLICALGLKVCMNTVSFFKDKGVASSHTTTSVKIG